MFLIMTVNRSFSHCNIRLEIKLDNQRGVSSDMTKTLMKGRCVDKPLILEFYCRWLLNVIDVDF